MFHAKGDGRLEDVALLLPMGEDRVSGSYHLDLTEGGTIAAPTTGGHLTIDAGHYESLSLGTIIDGLSVDMAGDRDQIVVRHATATDGAKGAIQISGGVHLLAAAGPALDLTTTLKHFQFIHTDGATGFASGDIRVSGNLPNPTLAANLSVDSAQVYLTDPLPPSVQPLAVTVIDSRTGQVLNQPPPPSGAPPMVVALDIKVAIPGQFIVRGRGLDSVWAGNIAVTGNNAAPDIHGSVQISRGTMNFLGKTLNLTRGTIDLPGGDEIRPQLDFVAQATTGQLTAEVDVAGPADHPKISLTSEPSYPQDEILSQLLFGRDATQLTPFEGLEIAEAAAQLANGGPSVVDRVRMKLGLSGTPSSA
jgi:translocation and assembly module TamB